MEKLQKKKWLFLAAAAVFLVIWAVLGIAGRNGKPEAVADKYLKAYVKQDVKRMAKCYAPDRRKEMEEELKDDFFLDGWQDIVSELVKCKVIVGDTVYGKGDKKDTAEVSYAIIMEGGSALSGVEMEALTLEKVGNKWYIGE